jgi:hypothetical protein
LAQLLLCFLFASMMAEISHQLMTAPECPMKIHLWDLKAGWAKGQKALIGED